MGYVSVKRTLALLVQFLVLSGGLAQQPAPSKEPSRLFTAAEIAADLNSMSRTLEEVHPDLYNRISRKEFAEEKERIVSSLKQPISQRECYPMIAGLLAKLQDGHTNAIEAPESWRTHFANGGFIFPFEVTFDKRGVIVAQNYADNEGMAIGDLILSINGRNARELFESLLGEVSGERLPYKIFLVQYLFARELWAHNIDAPYRIVYQSQLNGKNRTITLSGITSQTRLETQKRIAGASAPYSYRNLAEGITYLDFQSMSGTPEAFRKFLDEMFQQMKSSNSKGLVVDLRQNSGGNSSVGEELLSYITGKPYKMADRKEWKVSQLYKDFIRQQSGGSANQRYLNATNGQIITARSSVKMPRDNPLRFNGPVSFLIGPRTFSSAVMLANAVGDFKLATLVGEETGGIPTEFGEVYTFRLPVTGLMINVSSARFVRANGDERDRNGVLPDVPVKQTNPDSIKRVDTVLERACQVLLRPN